MITSHKPVLGILCLMLSVLCLLGLAQPASAAPSDTGATEFTYTTLVHNKPRNSSSVIGKMEEGTVVTVLDEDGDFYQVDCFNMTGYIAKQQLRKLPNGQYTVSCVRNSPETSTHALTALADALRTRASILKLAQEQLGTRYVYGGRYPGGFDCSGLTFYAYEEHGVSLHRCADEQLQDGLIVSSDSLQVGDLLFFRAAGTPWLASHVGIYVGDNQMIHASNQGIVYSDLSESYYEGYYLCARRIIQVSPTEMQEIPTATGMRMAARSRVGGLRTAD